MFFYMVNMFIFGLSATTKTLLKHLSEGKYSGYNRYNTNNKMFFNLIIKTFKINKRIDNNK